jgi:hypothetical protein
MLYRGSWLWAPPRFPLNAHSAIGGWVIAIHAGARFRACAKMEGLDEDVQFHLITLPRLRSSLRRSGSRTSGGAEACLVWPLDS